jgi:hypothetical protein
VSTDVLRVGLKHTALHDTPPLSLATLAGRHTLPGTLLEWSEALDVPGDDAAGVMLVKPLVLPRTQNVRGAMWFYLEEVRDSTPQESSPTRRTPHRILLISHGRRRHTTLTCARGHGHMVVHLECSMVLDSTHTHLLVSVKSTVALGLQCHL